MSINQTTKCYSDDQWWELQEELQDDHYEQQQQQQQLLLNYQKIAPPPDSDHAGRHNAKLSTSSAPQYPDLQYTTSIATSVSPDNSTKPPVQAPRDAARPKRRRRRGGTMATTIFLNSTITNFRELVQQHTGMMSNTPTTTTTTSSYYSSCNQKGPITICFANYSSSSSTSESALGFNNGNQ